MRSRNKDLAQFGRPQAGGLFGRAYRGATLVLVAALLGCGAPFDQIRTRAEAADREIAIEVIAHEEAPTLVVVGPMWAVEERIPESAVAYPPPAGQPRYRESRRILAALEPGTRRTVRLGTGDLDSGTWLVQAVAQPAGSKRGAIGRPWVVRVGPGGMSVERLVDDTRRRHLPGVLLTYGTVFVLVALLWGLGFKRLRLALVLLAIVGLVLVRLRSGGTRIEIENAGQAPPLVWPSDWPLEGQWERALGDDGAALVERVRTERRSGELLWLVLTARSGPALHMATKLRLAFPDAVPISRHAIDENPAGLRVYLDSDPPGMPLFRNRWGALARGEQGDD